MKSYSILHYSRLVIYGSLFFIASCKKFVSIPPPDSQLESIVIFDNDQTAVSAVTGLYSMIGLSNTTFINGGITLYSGAAADEIYSTAPNTDIDPFFTNSISPSHANLFSKLWRPAYNNNCIYSANSTIAGLNQSSKLSDSLKQQLIAECKVIRSLAYFYLVNLFGDVPLVTTPDFSTNALLGRTATPLIYEQLATDLSSAFTVLHTNYPTANRARVNKWTVAALLARIYLYQKDWAHAEYYSNLVIISGTYSLNSSLNAVFTSTSSNETIWQLIRDSNPTSDGATFIPASTTTKPTYTITTNLLNAFMAGDLRKNAWLAKNTISSIDYYYPNKYKSRLATQAIEYQILFRLAEQYLIRAEARAQQNNLAGAASDLNMIRNRAGLGNTSANTQSTLIDAILAERRLEFCFEMGHRWLDLKRTGKADAVLQPIKGSNWQSTDVFFPIPQSEIDKNPNLTQNPGY
jgi:hypothetical protein